MSLPRYSISTADWVAAARDWHLRNTIPIFEDPYARALSGRVLNLVQILKPLEWLLFKFVLDPIMPSSMCVVMRARYAEQALEQAVDRGVRQYVILGAGMDSFAFRRPDLMRRIQAYEVDHPVTQGAKLRRIKRAGLEVASNHHFVAADLSEVSPLDALAGTPFDTSQPTFVSLLGVAYYLTPDDLAATMRSIAQGMHAGTRLVLDYMLDPASADQGTHELRRRMLAFVEKRGEPMRSAYSLAEMDRLASSAGFEAVENFKMVDLSEAYIGDPKAVAVQPPDIFAFGNFEVS